MIYFIILGILVFCIWYYDVHDNTKWKQVAFWGIFVIFFLLSGLRWKIGIDTLMYMRTWDEYGNFWDFHWLDDIRKFQDSSENVERYREGWILYVMFLKSIWNDFTLVQLTTSLLFNTALFLTVKKWSPKPFLTLLIFYINFKFLEFEFEIMRETVAVSIFLLGSFPAFMEKKWIRYYLWTFLCFEIHTSAVLMFALPLIRNIDWNLKQYTFFIFIPTFILAAAGRMILGNLVNIFLGGQDFISQYAASAVEEDNNINYYIMYGLQPVLMYLISFIGFRHFKEKAFTPLVFFSIGVSIFSMIYFTASRLVNYIIIIDFIALTPIFYWLVRKFHTVWVAVLLLLIYFSPTLYSFRFPINVARYYPYQWVIDPKRTELQKTL